MREPSGRISYVMLVLATIACFGVVCTYGFTNTEDEGLIWRNRLFNPPTATSLRQIWTTPHLFLYVPATYTAWWAIAQFAQLSGPDADGAMLNAWVFHSANLVVHIVSAVLVLQLLRRLTRRNGPALIGALLFAIHPLQTEAVAWTTGMKDTLCGVFSFAALLIYVRYAQGIPHAGAERSEERAQRRPGSVAFALATLFLMLALFSKPAAVVVPVMALVIDALILQRSGRAIAKSLWFWFGLTIPIMIIARRVQPAAEVTPPPLWARPLVAADALSFYLTKLIAPYGLTVNYWRTPQSIIDSGMIFYTWIVLLLVAAIVWWSRRRWMTAAFLLFVAGVLPVLGLTTFLYQQFSTVADRFVYLSMLGPALAVAWLMSRRWNRATVSIATILLIVLGVMTVRQSLVWRNRLTLYAHNVAVMPEAPGAHSVYAGALIGAGRLDDAIAELEVVMRMMPNEDTKALIERLRKRKLEPQMNTDQRR